MKIRYYFLTLFSLMLVLNSCKKEDDGITKVPEEDRQERQDKDKVILTEYLQTHYYNSAELAANPNPSIDDIVITKLGEGETVPDGHTLLSADGAAMPAKTTVFQDIEYEYYVLKIRQGEGEDSPNFTDKIRLRYSGNLLDATVFDSAASPIEFDLVSLIPGWSRVIPDFNAASSFVENPDGTVSFDNPGIGVMFIPSGLAYFSSSTNGIPVYSSLAFKFELYQTELNDHDNDRIPSFLEDINNDLDPSNDDTDGDDIPNISDQDDDGDGVLTFNELQRTEYVVNTNEGEVEPVLASNEFEYERTEDAGIITIKTVKIVDANSNNVDDYLEKEVTTDYSLEN